jgi:hypothetical protein
MHVGGDDKITLSAQDSGESLVFGFEGSKSLLIDIRIETK